MRLAILVLVGCGRIGFDPLNDGATMGVDAALATVEQRAYLKASNTNAGDLFGYSLALSADGTTLAVGARDEDGNGVVETDNSVSSAGAAYVFTRNGDTWSQQAYLKASGTPAANDRFGVSVALSSDGSVLAIGQYGATSGAGRAEVFTRTGTTWMRSASVKASAPDPNDEFGFAVALSADGTVLAIGANREDSAARGIDGNEADNAALDSGAVYVFALSSGSAIQRAYVKSSDGAAGDRFGVSVSLSADGATLAVGSYLHNSGAGTVYVYEHAAAWSEVSIVHASVTGPAFEFGHTVALSGDGATLAIAADREDTDGLDAGAVYGFVRSGGSWLEQQRLTAASPAAGEHFGTSLGISNDGSTLAIGVDHESSNAGSAYVLTRTGNAWSALAHLHASNTDAGDELGTAIALAANASTIAVGAPSEASSASGVGGDETDNSAAAAGAVYVFQ